MILHLSIVFADGFHMAVWQRESLEEWRLVSLTLPPSFLSRFLPIGKETKQPNTLQGFVNGHWVTTKVKAPCLNETSEFSSDQNLPTSPLNYWWRVPGRVFIDSTKPVAGTDVGVKREKTKLCMVESVLSAEHRKVRIKLSPAHRFLKGKTGSQSLHRTSFLVRSKQRGVEHHQSISSVHHSERAVHVILHGIKEECGDVKEGIWFCPLWLIRFIYENREEIILRK